ncbi:hypothetical protein AVMA1855_19535 [Acidovorax sp. SUPP1855]|uniref:hypothetical protein n=1 Tax=Acidovorax sp. SUPP1855 TaxID=431774 RepID=UPI0023DE6020|nr:hypothetical protein [Acidovorax sp. SUPP1855]GKS86381.1 hypothetical protein AVMA1855_19535 [Acidovorax sp. SUPP1855]
MTISLQRSPLPLIGRPLPGASALFLALMLAGCGGSGGSDATVPAVAATCASPDTHCAPKP